MAQCMKIRPAPTMARQQTAHLRQDGEKLQLGKTWHKLRLQPNTELQRGRPFLHHNRHEDRHATVCVRERQKQLEGFFRCGKHASISCVKR